jgi:hypothetical protein
MKVWQFCLRATAEGLLISILLSAVLSQSGASARDMSRIRNWQELFFLAVIVAPLWETIAFQTLPIAAARYYKMSFRSQILVSTVLFTIPHMFHGIGTGLAAGLVGGFYLAFTYSHWVAQSQATAFAATALSHALRNGLALLMLAAGGYSPGK